MTEQFPRPETATQAADPQPAEPSPPEPPAEAAAAGEPQPARRPPFPWWWLVAAVAALILLYYPVGMLLAHKIDDDFDFTPGKVEAGQSRAVAVAAALIRREIDVNKWTPNDPFFFPTWGLDDMPNYQQGLVAGVGRFVAAVAAEAGTQHGPAGVDTELERAAGLLKYPGTVWMFDPRTSWAPTASSEKQYRAAQRSLELYNDRVARGGAAFERQPAAVAGLVAAVVHDLDTAANELDLRLAKPHWALFDTRADDTFYSIKGRVYAYGLLLRELGWDCQPMLQSRGLAVAWGRMVELLRQAALLAPPVVINGAPDAALLPSHLAAQGFLVARARAQAAELAEALRREPRG